MKTAKISVTSRVLLLLVTGLLLGSLYFPMWSIELTAPQYPEGLELKLHVNKIGGDVEIINGLNHYIGMKTLHTENFIEFKILPYIIGLFGLSSLLVFLFAKRKGVFILFTSLITFAILAGLDFYRWNYNYGHDLDPSAAIKVPGMAYQPPVIGYKELLNFGAYSMPDIGGWMLIVSGAILLLIILLEYNILDRFKRKNITVVLLLIAFLTSCNTKEVEPIKLNIDQCSFCKMNISDGKFGSELITKKGRVYKFDDILCMKNYVIENTNVAVESYFVHDYTKENILIPAETAFFISGENINSPMRGNIAAFSSDLEAKDFSDKLQATNTTFYSILNKE